MLEPNRPPLSSSLPNERVAWLDGVRAIAILAVVLVHCYLAIDGLPKPLAKACAAGQYGVQLFFAISAITICSTLSHRLDRGESLLSWWARRFFRIAPLYYCGIVLYTVLDRVALQMGSRSVEAGNLSGVLLNLTFLNAWANTGKGAVVPGGWSISVEMSFYLIAPILFAAATKLRSGVVILLSCACASLLASSYLWRGLAVENSSFEYFFPLTQFPVLLIGVAFFALSKNWLMKQEPLRASYSRTAVLVAMISLLLGEACGTGLGISNLLAPTIFGLFSCSLITLARGPLRTLMSSPPMAQMGTISYGIYLSHFAILMLLRMLAKESKLNTLIPPSAELMLFFLITVTTSVWIARFTRRTIERPAIRCGNLVANHLNRPFRRGLFKPFKQAIGRLTAPSEQ